MSGEAQHCLVISDGRRGIENQALGLAEACARLRPLTLKSYTVKPARLIARLPPKAQLRLSRFDLPTCDIAIGCGRQAIAPLLFLKATRPEVMSIYIQDPRIDLSYFDLVIAPEHDAVRGPNVELMTGSPNRITEFGLRAATSDFGNELSNYSQPRAAFLIGGTSKSHQLDKSSHDQHLSIANQLLAEGYSLLITTSRRTPDFAVADWIKFASNSDAVWFHDETKPNPYFAFLGAADKIFVTEESTNMLTESCATGKPVYRLPMAGHMRSGRGGKFQTLYDALERRCGVIRYDQDSEWQAYPPLNETARIAQRVWSKFDQNG